MPISSLGVNFFSGLNHLNARILLSFTNYFLQIYANEWGRLFYAWLTYHPTADIYSRIQRDWIIINCIQLLSYFFWSTDALIDNLSFPMYSFSMFSRNCFRIKVFELPVFSNTVTFFHPIFGKQKFIFVCISLILVLITILLGGFFADGCLIFPCDGDRRLFRWHVFLGIYQVLLVSPLPSFAV